MNCILWHKNYTQQPIKVDENHITSFAVSSAANPLCCERCLIGFVRRRIDYMWCPVMFCGEKLFRLPLQVPFVRRANRLFKT